MLQPCDSKVDLFLCKFCVFVSHVTSPCIHHFLSQLDHVTVVLILHLFLNLPFFQSLVCLSRRLGALFSSPSLCGRSAAVRAEPRRPHLHGVMLRTLKSLHAPIATRSLVRTIRQQRVSRQAQQQRCGSTLRTPHLARKRRRCRCRCRAALPAPTPLTHASVRSFMCVRVACSRFTFARSSAWTPPAAPSLLPLAK